MDGMEGSKGNLDEQEKESQNLVRGRGGVKKRGVLGNFNRSAKEFKMNKGREVQRRQGDGLGGMGQ